MRRLGVGGLAAALLIGWAATVLAATGDTTDDSDAKPAAKQTSGGSWFSNWFGMGSAPAKKPDKKPAKPAKPKPAAGLDSAASIRDREEAALLRRMAVCDKLKQIAVQNNDDALAKLADQLEQRAEAVYYQRINPLPASQAEPLPEEPVVEQKKSARETTWSLHAHGAQPHVVTGRSASADPIADREEDQP
jgi:hypothetical protein